MNKERGELNNKIKNQTQQMKDLSEDLSNCKRKAEIQKRTSDNITVNLERYREKKVNYIYIRTNIRSK